MDIHDTDGVSSTIVKPKTGVFYIPYHCLVTNEISNLLLAGRCISTDYAAHACIRVMITCMRLGEAAGLAAAEACTWGQRPMPWTAGASQSSWAFEKLDLGLPQGYLRRPPVF